MALVFAVSEMNCLEGEEKGRVKYSKNWKWLCSARLSWSYPEDEVHCLATKLGSTRYAVWQDGAMLWRYHPHTHTFPPIIACIVAGVPSAAALSVQGEERNDLFQNISAHQVLLSSFRSGAFVSLGDGGDSWGHLRESLLCHVSCSKKRTCSIV